MSRLLVFGMSPLPFENTSKNFGPGIRAWQFIKPLLPQNHEILLLANRIPYIYPPTTPPEEKHVERNLTYIHMSESLYSDVRYIQKKHDQFVPDAILAATVFSTPPLKDLKTSVPIWIDLFGHVMAEAQAKAFRYEDDTFLKHFWEHEITALAKGDIFSTVSEAQAFATIGELGVVGRLNCSTTSYNFCHKIPCAMDPEPIKKTKQIFRGISVPEDAFVVLWSGGFNTWTDVQTLVIGLENAMSQNPNIWFVSTGGKIDGHDEKTYPRFVNLVNNSPHRERFVLHGWVPNEIVSDYYFEANIGINIDHFMYEGLFGSKNRVLDWMRAGLPSLIGELCELSREMVKEGLAYGFPLHDPDALAEKLLYVSSHPVEVREIGQKAKAYGEKHLTFSQTTKPFQAWLESPVKAPDADRNIQKSIKSLLSDHSETERVEKQTHYIKQLESYIHRVESEFSKLEKSKLKYLQKHKPKTSTKVKALNLSEDIVRVSVVIVSWNGEKYLEDCIHSILAQNYSPLECIVVDNASNDDSVSIVKSNFPDVRIIQNSQNTGFAKGTNQGLKSANGDVIILLNQDTVVRPGFIESIVDELRSDPQIGIVGCKILYPDGKILQHAGGVIQENGLTDHVGAGEKDEGQYDQNRDCDYVTGAAFGFKTSLIDEIGYFDERFSPAYFEELDFCVRATRNRYRIRYAHDANVYHHESTSTGKFSPRFYFLYHRNRLRFILKHHHLRYLLGTFRRAEWYWIKHALPKEQIIPLLKAYMVVSHRFGWIFIRELTGRIR